MVRTKSMLETIVGAVVLLLCIMFVFVVYRNGSLDSYNNENNYVLNASFERIDGIAMGSPVMISGINIGKVVEQRLDSTTYNAALKISIHNDVKLPVDTSAEIVSNGLLGDKYIALVPGSDSEYLKDGDHIEFTQSSVSIENLISKMVFGLEMHQGKKEDSSSSEEESGDEGGGDDSSPVVTGNGSPANSMSGNGSANNGANSSNSLNGAGSGATNRHSDGAHHGGGVASSEGSAGGGNGSKTSPSSATSPRVGSNGPNIHEKSDDKGEVKKDDSHQQEKNNSTSVSPTNGDSSIG